MIGITGRASVGFLYIALIAAVSPTAFAQQRAKDCQILDQVPEAVYEFDFGYIPRSSVEVLGKTDIMEVNADWACAYFRTSAGNIDLNLRAESTIFHNSVNGLFPSQVAKVAADAGWAMRFDRGLAFQVRAQPGIYSDFDHLSGDSFSYPFSLALIRAYDPSFSGMAGIEIRPGFDLPVMPLIGVVWAINDELRLDLRCPRSKFTYYMAKGWNTYMAMDWDNMSYNIAGNVDMLTMDDFKAYWGVMHQLPNQAIVRAEIGEIFERSVKFGNGGSDFDFDMDSSLFFRVGMGGAF